MFLVLVSPALSSHLINILHICHPHYCSLGELVYFLYFVPAQSLSSLTHTFCLCQLLQYLSMPLFFLTSSPFLSPIPPLCDNIDYCSACASTCRISNRPLRQKPRATVSPLCSPRILTSPAAVPTVQQPPSTPRLCISVCCMKEVNRGWWVGHHKSYW